MVSDAGPNVASVVDTAATEQLVLQIHKQADSLFVLWTKTNELVHDWQQQITSTKQVCNRERANTTICT